MAISATHFHLLKHLHAAGKLPQGGSILEIGEANVYGDFDPREIVKLLPKPREVPLSTDGYGYAKLLYRALFGTPESLVVSVDASGPKSLRLDLNLPIELPRMFDVSINHGTAEHIFNVSQVFRTMHVWTKPGGLMIHEGPFTGWVDHGFYTIQPTLYWDLAHANGYQVELFASEHLASQTIIQFDSREDVLAMKRRDQLPDNLMLFVAMRKVEDKPFVVPMQGVYVGTAGEVATQAWREMR